jgi:ketosteroid isomerase-like protein
MNKFAIIFLSIIFSNEMKAQNADALIRVEKDFENACLQKGIREGFLSYVDSNGIFFTDKGPVDAKPFWTALPAFEGVFSWAPTYAEMSESGEWGFTTGNFEHRKRTIHDSVEQSGQYTTIWHKTKAGEWKYLIDIGNEHEHDLPASYAITISVNKFRDSRLTNKSGLEELEARFIRHFEKSIPETYHEFSGSQYILNVPGHVPLISADSAIALLTGEKPGLVFHPAGAFLSEGQDMGVVYGTFEQDSKRGSYIRVWRHEMGGWKVALEVIK